MTDREKKKMKIRITLSREVVESLRKEAREFVIKPENMLQGWNEKMKLGPEK